MILLPQRDARLNLWNAPWKFLCFSRSFALKLPLLKLFSHLIQGQMRPTKPPDLYASLFFGHPPPPLPKKTKITSCPKRGGQKRNTLTLFRFSFSFIFFFFFGGCVMFFLSSFFCVKQAMDCVDNWLPGKLILLWHVRKRFTFALFCCRIPWKSRLTYN